MDRYYVIGIVTTPAGLSVYQREALLAVVQEHDKMRKYYVLHTVPALGADLLEELHTRRQVRVDVGSRHRLPDVAARYLRENCDEVYAFPNRRSTAAHPDYATKVHDALVAADYPHARIIRAWCSADALDGARRGS